MGTTYYSIFKNSNGDVGIGTASPTAQSGYRFLQVNGSTSAIIEATVGGTRIGGFDSTASALYVGTIGSYPVIFRTAVDEKMRISANGNVGIGTSSPGSKLDVNGTFRTAINNLTIFNDYIYVSPTENNTLNSAYFTNGIADMWINYAGYNNGNTQFRNFNIGNGKNGVICWFDGTNKRMSINNSQSASYTLDVNGTSGFRDTMAFGPSIGLISWGSMGGGTGFGVRGESGRALSLGSNGNWDYLVINTSGNVGIGTSSPNAKLHVYSSVAGSGAERTTPVDVLTLESENTTAQEFDGFGQTIIFRGSTYNNNTQRTLGKIIHQINDDSVNTTRGTSLNFQLLTNATGTTLASRMFINYDGNVGIGTTSPGCKLVIVGETQILSSSAYNTHLNYNDAGTNFITTANTGYTYFRGSSNNVTTMAVYGGGGVSVGTSSLESGCILTVRASNSARMSVTDGTTRAHFWPTGGAFYISTETNSPMVFITNAGERMRIASDGNVGVGTSSPGVKLDVVGGVRSFSSAGNYGLITNGSFQAVGDHGGTYMLDLDNTGSADLVNIKKSGTSRFYITNGGNIGIGTTSPAAKLAVSGNLFLLGVNAQRQYTYFAIGSASDDIWLRSSSSFANNGASASINLSRLTYQSAGSGNDLNDKVGIWLRGFYDNSGGGLPIYLGGYAYSSQIPAVTITGLNSDGAGGNVGIGTTNPTGKFHIYNSTSVDTILESGTSGTTGKLIFKTSDNADLNKYIMQESYYMILNGHANEGFKFRDSAGNVLLSIFGSNNAYASRVGIGTTSPSTTFHVYGNAEVGDSTADTGLIVRHGSGSSQYGRIRFYSASTNINTIHSFPTAWQGGTFLNSSAGAINLTGTNGITFGAWNNVDVAFASGGTNYFKGNVGVGISTPSAILNIRASAPTSTGTVTTGTNLLIDSNTSNYITFRNTADNGTYAGLTFLDNNTGGYVVFRNYTGDVATGSDSMIYGTYQDHIFQNGSSETINGKTETMRIKGNGNVGIGTNNPGYKLQVNSGGIAYLAAQGNALVMGDDATYGASGTGRYVALGYGGLSNGANKIFAHNTGEDGIYICSATSRNINFRPGGGATDYVVITSVGNVGIGTTSPSYKLDVNSASASFALRLLGSSVDGPVIRLENTASGGRIYHVGSTATGSGAGTGFSIYDVTGSGARMLIDANGNVGIGTTSPADKLEVSGTTRTDKLRSNGIVYLGITGTKSSNASAFNMFDINNTGAHQTIEIILSHHHSGGGQHGSFRRVILALNAYTDLIVLEDVSTNFGGGLGFTVTRTSASTIRIGWAGATAYASGYSFTGWIKGSGDYSVTNVGMDSLDAV